MVGDFHEWRKMYWESRSTMDYSAWGGGGEEEELPRMLCPRGNVYAYVLCISVLDLIKDGQKNKDACGGWM